jgi:hypothetical protein
MSDSKDDKKVVNPLHADADMSEDKKVVDETAVSIGEEVVPYDTFPNKEILSAIELLKLSEGVSYTDDDINKAFKQQLKARHVHAGDLEGGDKNELFKELNAAKVLLGEHFAKMEHRAKNSKEGLDALSASSKTRTEDASRAVFGVEGAKTFTDIQKDLNQVNKIVNALLIEPDTKKLWKASERYKVAFKQEERDALLKMQMIVPGEDGAEHSVEFQHAPEYIEKRIKQLATPLGTTTKEYEDLVSMQKQVANTVKHIKDPRSTGQTIQDALFDTAKVAGKVTGGLVAVGAVIGVGAAVIGAGASAGTAGLGVGAGVVGAALGVAVLVGVLKATYHIGKWLGVNAVNPMMKSVQRGIHTLDAAQAKFRVLTDILPYEQNGDDANLTKDECIKLADKLENALVLSEVYESLDEINSVSNTHLNRIIDLRKQGGQNVAKYSKLDGHNAYDKDVIAPKMADVMRQMLGKEPNQSKGSTTELLSKANRSNLEQLSAGTWSNFNKQLKHAQSELIECVRGQFKNGKDHHMGNGTYVQAVEVIQQAEIANSHCDTMIAQRVSFDKTQAAQVGTSVSFDDENVFGLRSLFDEEPDAGPEEPKVVLTGEQMHANTVDHLTKVAEAAALVAENAAPAAPIPPVAKGPLRSADEAAAATVPDDEPAAPAETSKVGFFKAAAAKAAEKVFGKASTPTPAARESDDVVNPVHAAKAAMEATRDEPLTLDQLEQRAKDATTALVSYMADSPDESLDETDEKYVQARKLATETRHDFEAAKAAQDQQKPGA